MTEIRKLTATQKQNLKEFTKKGTLFIRKSSEWTTGSGNFIKARTLPPFVIRLARSAFLPDDVKAFFEENKRVSYVLYIAEEDRDFVLNSIAD